MVIIGEDVGVREIGARGGGRHEEVDKWAVRGVFRLEPRAEVFLCQSQGNQGN